MLREYGTQRQAKNCAAGWREPKTRQAREGSRPGVPTGLRLAARARERPVANAAGADGAGDLVAVDGAAELERQRHRVLDGNLEADRVAAGLAVEDRGGGALVIGHG